MADVLSPIIVALDFSTLDEALALADRLDPGMCRVKVGKELFTTAGPSAVNALTARGFEVFLDLKYHDIPNTVAGACAAAADLGCWMVNVHASGGRQMLEQAASTLAKRSESPLLIAVTVLTSLDDEALTEVGIAEQPAPQVERLSRLAADCGLDGVVCSPLEIALVRKSTPSGFLMVTPGVRPAGASKGDQVRIATPGAALAAGSSYLVIGRPITQAEHPEIALTQIIESCELA